MGFLCSNGADCEMAVLKCFSWLQEMKISDTFHRLAILVCIDALCARQSDLVSILDLLRQFYTCHKCVYLLDQYQILGSAL